MKLLSLSKKDKNDICKFLHTSGFLEDYQLSSNELPQIWIPAKVCKQVRFWCREHDWDENQFDFRDKAVETEVVDV